jgi:hypothetical protein
VEAFSNGLAKSAIERAILPIDSACLSLRLKAKSGIVAGGMPPLGLAFEIDRKILKP